MNFRIEALKEKQAQILQKVVLIKNYSKIIKKKMNYGQLNNYLNTNQNCYCIFQLKILWLSTNKKDQTLKELN